MVSLRACSLLLVLCAAATSPALAQSPPAGTFRNRAGTFQLELPPAWRQLAPNEARRIQALPGAPLELTYVEPRLFYAVGPVDDWLAGRFDSPWLYVVEQENEWVLDEDFERDVVPKLREMWQTKSEATGVEHRIADIHREEIGTGKHRAIVARRESTPKDGRPPTASLDVHVPAGGQQISLSFTCAIADFDRQLPEFRRRLATMTFARAAHGEVKLSDRLWTPILTGLLVTGVLLVLYKHTRRRASS